MAAPTSISQVGQAAEAAFTRRMKLTITLAYYTAFIVLGLVAASLGPTLPGLAANVQVGIAQISLLFLLRSGGYLIGSFLAGRLYDRLPGHPLMAGLILALALTMALIPTLPTLWVLGAVILLVGLAEGQVDVGGNTMLVWLHRGGELGPFMNGLHFFFGLGAFLSPVIVALAIQHTGGIAWAYWALALIMLPCALWLARLPSPAAKAPAGSAPVKPALPLLIGIVALFNFFYVGAEVGYGGWVFTYATTLGMGSQASAAYLTSAFWGALTVGRLASIPVAMRVSPRVMLLISLLLVLAGLGLIQAAPDSLTALWVGTLAVGLGMAAIFPTMLTLAGSHMTLTSQVTSLFFIGSSLGAMFLPWLIGQLFAPLGAPVVMALITASTALGLALFGLMSAYVSRLSSH